MGPGPFWALFDLLEIMVRISLNSARIEVRDSAFFCADSSAINDGNEL
jgi:hypothetical protein